jgi:hypothetical protein
MNSLQMQDSVSSLVQRATLAQVQEAGHRTSSLHLMACMYQLGVTKLTCVQMTAARDSKAEPLPRTRYSSGKSLTASLLCHVDS